MNDPVDQFTLVYQSPSQAQPQPQSGSAMPEPAWHTGHHASAVPSPVSPFSPSSFSAANRSQDHAAFPPSSSSFPQHGSSGQFASPNPDSPGSDPQFSQVEGSIGPTRVVTRRHRATHSPSLHLSPTQEDVSTSTDLHRHAESPVNGAQPTQPQAMSERLTLSMHTGSMPISLHSPHHVSPTPVSPVYSPYGLDYSPHSRSNSNSNSQSAPQHRSVSPAVSATSNLTTDSSSNSPPNVSQPFSSPSQPSIGNISSNAERTKQRKQRLFNVDRKAICMYHLQYPNARQEDIAQRYGVERSTISKILKHKTKWMNVPEAENLRVAKHRPSKFPAIEQELVEWLYEATRQHIQLTDASIRAQAKQVAQKLRISEDKFKASSGWIENFKHRHGIRKGKWQGHAKEPRVTRLLSLLPRRDVDGLPQLSAAFDTHSHSDSAAEDGGRDFPDFELSSSGSPGSDGMRSRMGDLGGAPPPPMTLHAPWHRSTEPPVSVSLASHQQPQHDSLLRDTAMQQQHQHHTHPPVPPTLHLDISRTHSHAHHPHSPDSERSCDIGHAKVDFFQNGFEHHHHHHHHVTAETPLDVYPPMPPISAMPAVPTLAQAEDALNKVMLFVQSQDESFLSPQAHQLLAQIKYAFFQAANGLHEALTYERPRHAVV